ncbi:MAG: NAD(P)-dependent dehydrogenase (short-subunit alcohol dehydrogenase family) [Glaciecola sp.]
MNNDCVAIVAGATGALGRPLVEAFLERGTPVIAVSRTERALAQLVDAHPEVEAVVADIADPAVVDLVASAIGDRAVEAVVNVAAVPLSANLMDADLALIARGVEVKVNGLVHLVRAARTRLADRRLPGGGRVIAIGGSFGYDPNPMAGSAGVANAALANAVRQLARVLGPEGISVHVVAPGPVLTDRLLTLIEREAADQHRAVADILSTRASDTARGSIASVDDVIWAVMTLLDPRASVSTGSTFFVDGGARTAIP